MKINSILTGLLQNCHDLTLNIFFPSRKNNNLNKEKLYILKNGLENVYL